MAHNGVKWKGRVSTRSDVFANAVRELDGVDAAEVAEQVASVSEAGVLRVFYARLEYSCGQSRVRTRRPLEGQRHQTHRTRAIQRQAPCRPPTLTHCTVVVLVGWACLVLPFRI